ncbi:hypothetical protein ACH5RR_011214 [Cinchona calisaya]|uniref:Pentatricopeptide repeat-containing protein n=1 Tax=Cinchona calisaya TaxID=153742 RepID=A0ABD3A4U0_9GENT
MVSAYAQVGDDCVHKAFRVAQDMQREELEPNRITLVSLLHAVSGLRALHVGKSTLRRSTRVRKEGYIVMDISNNGLADEAVILFQQMQKEKVNPDSVALVSLLQALVQVGCLSLAREVHTRVDRVLLDEDVSIINCLISIYSKYRKLGIAKSLFEQVAERDLATSNSMISAYGMHGDCVQTLELFEQMKEYKIAPDGLTFTSLLSACSHSGMVDEGLCVFKSMIEEYRLTPSDEHYSCMVDLLSRAGRLDEAYELLKFLSSMQTASALGALLAACRIHENINMGEIIGRRPLELEP